MVSLEFLPVSLARYLGINLNNPIPLAEIANRLPVLAGGWKVATG
jgi:hypothetical protein